MKRHLLFVLVFSLTTLLSACMSAQPAPDTQALVNAANALDQAFLDAFNRGDAEALSGLYWDSPDVVSFQPDVLQARGMAAIKETNTQALAAMKGAKLEITESHQIPAGDMVVGWGLFKLTLPGENGAVTETVGRYSDLKAERDGKWVYLLDHASVPLPSPAQ